MSIRQDFVTETEVIVAAPHHYDRENPSAYHWHKLKDFYEPEFIKQAIEADKKFSILQNLIDPDKDIVGYCVQSPNVALVRNVFRKLLGKEHPLVIREVASNRMQRQHILKKLRHA